jgi:hypothetical protein
MPSSITHNIEILRSSLLSTYEAQDLKEFEETVEKVRKNSTEVGGDLEIVFRTTLDNITSQFSNFAV